MTTDAATVTELLQALVGKSLPQLCVSVGDLQMRFEGKLAVQLEGVLRVGTGIPVEPYSLDGLAYLLPMLNSEVTAAKADESGSLTLTIGATTLHCDADHRYEAWNYNGPDRALVASMPGGDFAIWSSR